MGGGSGHYLLGPENARVVLRTGREGYGAKAGHDLTIEVTDWSAQVDVPEGAPAAATVSARFELASMVVREGTGGARPLTDVDRGEIEENARRVLGVADHPTAVFESSQVVAGDGGGTISGTLTLGGVATPVQVRVQNVAPNRYLGSAVVTQSALGIKPYSAFLGALKVRDDVEVQIDADLPRAGSSA
jgi:polyisoprenoid-binding protein YceI